MTSFVRSGTADLCIDDTGPTAAAGPPLVCLHAGVTDRRQGRSKYGAKRPKS